LGGLFFILVIFFVIVPLIKKFKESMDEGNNTNNRNRYGGYNGRGQNGYNNPNVYNDPGNKRITYDWKPDYDFPSNKEEQRDQSGQGSKDGRSRAAADDPVQYVARASSAQTVTRPTQPAAPNTRPSSAKANKQQSSASAYVKPFSAAVSGSKPASAVTKGNGQKNTAASVEKGKGSGADAADNISEVTVSEDLLKLDAVMPDYDYFVHSAGSYDVPDTGAFKFSDVVVDTKVNVNAVIPDLAESVRVDSKE
jgi:hypothetical protein